VTSHDKKSGAVDRAFAGRFDVVGCRAFTDRAVETVRPDGQEDGDMTDNILKLAQQARTNAQLLSVSTGGIRSLTREDALKARGEILEAARRLQAFEKELTKKIEAA
jgi:hypothetical protein